MNISSISSTLFARLDTQQKGYLDKSDLETALTATQAQSDPESGAATLFTALDGDGDGKVTQTELTTGLQNLSDALMQDLHRTGAGHCGGGAPPPGGPGGPEGKDTGFTQDELEEIVSASSTDDPRTKLMSAVADNFAAADTDGDGRVTGAEAHAWAEQAGVDTDKPEVVASGDSGALLLQKLAALLSAYGVTDDSAQGSTGGLIASA